MSARIFQRPKNAMQSGHGRNDEWVLEHVPAEPRKADPEGPQVKHSGHVPKTAFLSYVWEFSLCLKGMWMWGWGWDSSP